MNTAVRTMSRMQHWFPGTASPLIVSAPMAFVSTAKLACEVVRAKGLGFIQGGRDFTPESRDLKDLEEQLLHARTLLKVPDNNKSILPIGVGFVLFSPSASAHFHDTTAPILARHRPVAVWLFAPDPADPVVLARVISALVGLATTEYFPRIIVQVGSVAAAREAASLGADVIVAQGGDAGGHQFARTVGVVSLVPEVRDMLNREFGGRHIAVWGAGGVADGRGVAALMALGAEGVVLGTRYMVSPESAAEEYKREALLAASDGAVSTVKSYIHDHIQGNRSWPAHYDARALVHQSYKDDLEGMDFEANEARYKKAKGEGDVSMMVTWSGSGVGLIKTAMPAAEVTRTVRDEAIQIIKGMQHLV